jgi:hypothetical protein
MLGLDRLLTPAGSRMGLDGVTVVSKFTPRAVVTEFAKPVSGRVVVIEPRFVALVSTFGFVVEVL